jgi:hypothetical protein
MGAVRCESMNPERRKIKFRASVAVGRSIPWPDRRGRDEAKPGNLIGQSEGFERRPPLRPPTAATPERIGSALKTQPAC